MKARKKLAVALALLLVTSGSAFALGLGQIKVKSALNQPLEAVIPVVSATPAELRGLKVSLASSEDFQRAGISRERIQTPLKFKVEKRNGQTVILVSSEKPVNDPALDLLLELNWSNGKLLREFSILLDPAGMPTARVARAPAQTAPVEEKKPAGARPTATPGAAAPAARRGVTSGAAASSAPDISTGSSYTVHAGDNIWSIARRSTRSAGEINRMMMAIQRANPDAFFKDNINALKKGAVLRIPERSEMAEISARQAREEVRQQNEIWSNPAAASPSMMAGSSPRSGTTAAGGAATSGSRLELVPPREGNTTGSGRSGVAGGSGQAAVAGLRQELARARESLASEKQRSEDMAARVKDLEGIRDKNQRLLEMKNARIAELQAALDKANAAKSSTAGSAPPVREDIFAPAATGTAASVAEAATAGTAAAATVAGAASAAVAVAGTAPPSAATTPASAATASVTATPGTATTQAAATEPAVAATSAGQEAAQSAKPEAASPTPARVEPWYMQTWAWIAGIVVILGLLLLALLRRGGKSGDGRSERLSDALADDGGEYAEDLGEDSEDEYALLEEIEHHPEELSLHLELASLYYAHRNEAKFEGAAEAMYTHVDDPAQPEWQQVRAMGEELCPDHPLFAELHTDGTAADEDESSLAALVGEDREGDSDDSDEPGPHKGDGGYNFDFNLTPDDRAEQDVADAGTVADSRDAEEDEDEDLLSLSSLAGVEPDDNADEAPVSEEFDVDQVLADADQAEAADDDLEPGGEEVRSAADALSEDDIAPPDDEAGEAPSDEEFSSDPVDTKLDLARAYQDMGDNEGARAMLEEVLQEGSDAQKKAAQQILDDLG